MKGFGFFIIILTAVIIVGGIFLTTAKQDNTASPTITLEVPENYEYYWSQTCPHCTKVNEFVSSWDGADKIVVDKYEVNESRENSLKFAARGDYCNIPKRQLGVPLLITPEGQCLTGDAPIIDHYKSLEL